MVSETCKRNNVKIYIVIYNILNAYLLLLAFFFCLFIFVFLQYGIKFYCIDVESFVLNNNLL